MHRFVAMGLVMCCFSGAAHAARIWISDQLQLHGVEADSNEVMLSLHFPGIRALIADQEESAVWVLTGNRLHKVGVNGTRLANLRLRDFGLVAGDDDDEAEDSVRIAFDGQRRTLWIAAGRRLVQLDATGKKLSQAVIDQPVRSLAVSQDSSVWVLAERRLFQVAAEGNVSARHVLNREMFSEPHLLFVDALHNRIWLLSDRRILVSALSTPGMPIRTWSSAQRIDSATLDQETGTLWFTAGRTVAAYSLDAQQPGEFSLDGVGARGSTALAFDPLHTALWLAHRHGITKLDRLGQSIATIPWPGSLGAGADDEGDRNRSPQARLGVPVFIITPSLTLLQPPENALTNNARPEISLGYGAQCSSKDCEVPFGFLSSYRLSAILGGASIGQAFSFDPDQARSLYIPPQRLPEGTNRFEASVSDSFGHMSNKIDTSFVVDTVAPSFLGIQPSEGTVFSVNQVTVTATIDDPTGVVVVEELGANTAATTSANSATFVFPLVLQPGINNFKLTAIDRAGNVATRALALSYSPLLIDIEQPGDGASVQGQQVLVSGTWHGPENTGITVNGVVASVLGGRFYASVPIEPGANTVNATATTTTGLRVQESILVTSIGPAPIEINASPDSGVAPLEVGFEILSGSEIPIQRLEIDFDGDGSVDLIASDPHGQIAHTYPAPGAYPVSVSVVDAQGNTIAQKVQVTVHSAADLDRQLRAAWRELTSALLRGDRAVAMEYLNSRARAQYGPVFDILLPGIATILSSFSDLQGVALDSNVGEYAVNRTIDGVNRIFFIYFLRDIDGVWRVDSM